MLDALVLLIVIEILGVLLLPFTTHVFRALPDRGYGLGKLLSLLLVTYVVWLIGSFSPVASGPWLIVIVALALTGLSWWRWGGPLLANLHELRRIIAIEEMLFLAAFAVLTLLRANVFLPGINHTEQYMDLMLLNTSYHSASYPPVDAWMSGHTVNYYYFGYLMYATLLKLTPISISVGFNLALSLVFAFTVAGSFSLGYALTRSLRWATIAPVFVTLLGNWHAVLVQIPHDGLPSGASYWWFFASTRVVGGDTTINEFPLFSFILGDLHPHVMALPVGLLAMALGAAYLNDLRGDATSWIRGGLPWIVCSAVVIGSLFATNSWDFPTYLLVVSACVAAAGYAVTESRQWWITPALVIGTLAVASLVAYVPFYLHFRSLAHGIGLTYTHTDPWQWLQVFGWLILLCSLFMLALAVLLRPLPEDVELQEGVGTERGTQFAAAHEHGQTNIDLAVTVAAAVCFLVVGAFFHVWVLMVVLLLGIGAVSLLHRVLNTEEPNRADAFALVAIAVACLVLGITELIYLRDSFDASPIYRMNTVFKFYYQAWALLGIAAAYGVYRARLVVRQLYTRAAGLGVAGPALIATAGAAVYTFFALQGTVANGPQESLDGQAWLQAQQPGDYGAMQWLQRRTSASSVVLEASTAGAYDFKYGRISAFTGHPTVLGWAGHERQWRPNDPEVGQRFTDVSTIYTTPSVVTAKRLLRAYHVAYVFVGSTERMAYAAQMQSLNKFAQFMRPVYNRGGTQIYTW